MQKESHTEDPDALSQVCRLLIVINPHSVPDRKHFQ